MSAWKRLWRHTAARRCCYLAAFALLWQAVHALLIPDSAKLLFPSVPDIAGSLWRELLDGSMMQKTGYSLSLICKGILISLALALILTPICMISRTAKDLVRTLISVLDPLPGIALLPIAILWFGIGTDAIAFVMVHSVLWPMLLNVITGFDSVPAIYQDIGRSFGLSRLKQVGLIFAPAAFPSILTGVKTGWARAWRALISAEMVFGASGALGGLGWDIYVKRSYLDMPGMFASLIVIMVIGILVEEILWGNIERVTLRKWGMIR